MPFSRYDRFYGYWHCEVLQRRQGFGFITPDNGGKDVFVHISSIERSGMSTLVENQKVSFDTEADTRGKGDKAVNLKAP